MPELPEVETIKRQLASKIINKKWQGKKIIAVSRRAKILLIDFSDGSSLAFHLKLTGQLIFNGKLGKHTRRVFKFDDGSRLIFNDMRKFGWAKLIKNSQEITSHLGPEPFGLSLSDFQKALRKRPKAKIKPLLLDQKFIAGIGNIYSDEILFASKVKPDRLVKDLNQAEIKNILANTKKILKKAIALRGSSDNSYIDAFGQKGDYLKLHKVYRKTGQACPKCQTAIKRIRLAGRSAHFCPKCQT